MMILHVISSGGMYGAEAVILNLSRTLNESDNSGLPSRSSLGVFTNSKQPNHELYAASLREGIEAYPIACRGQLDVSVPKAIRSLAQRLQVDVVHAHGYKADMYTWVALRETTVPLVSTCHTWYDNDLALRVYGKLDRWILRQFDKVVAVSQEVHARLLSAGLKTERVHTISNGIDLRPFARAGPLHPNASPCVGLVGRLAPEKGCDVFIRAAAQVLQMIPEVQFSVAGEGSDRASLERLILELGIEQNVRLVGRCDDMPSFYRSLDILVSASRQEGLPIALLEGMASALPLVATRAGEVPTLVIDGVTGTLVGVEDIPALASAIYVLLRDARLRRSYGEAGRARVAAQYSAAHMTAAYLALYEQAVAQRKTARGRLS